jgi:hypothetical protein
MLHLSVYVASVSCFRDMFRESWGHELGAGRRGAASRRPADGVRSAPGVLRTGRARPHPGSCVLPARRERMGLRGRSGGRGARRDGWGQGTRAWRDEEDEKELQRYGESAARFCWTVRYCPMKSYSFRRIYGRQQFPCQYPHFSLLAFKQYGVQYKHHRRFPSFLLQVGSSLVHNARRRNGRPLRAAGRLKLPTLPSYTAGQPPGFSYSLW